MPKRKLKTERLSVSVTRQQKAVLQEIASSSDVPLARVIQEAIKEFIKRHPDRPLSLFERRPPPKG